jgi:hypothetical protein
MKLCTGLYVNEKEILENELNIYKNNIIRDYIHKTTYKTDVRFQWFDDKVIISWTNQGWCMDKDETIEKIITLSDEQIEIIKAFTTLIKYYENK